MCRGMQQPPLLQRAVESAFWLLLLACQLPVAGALWLPGRLLRLPDTFRAFALDLVRWRGGRGKRTRPAGASRGRDSRSVVVAPAAPGKPIGPSCRPTS
jgi:hypothetical protein